MRDPFERPVVFATPFKAIATTFGVGCDDRLANQGIIDGQLFVLISDRDNFAADKPVHIYQVERPQQEHGPVEYTSSQPAPIIVHETRDSAITAIRAYRVTHCFVPNEEYAELRRPGNTNRLVYVGHFKCNKRRIADYPNLWSYTRELYQTPGIRETVDFSHIKGHYYQSHRTINPTGIVPLGPIIDFDAPPDRRGRNLVACRRAMSRFSGSTSGFDHNFTASVSL